MKYKTFRNIVVVVGLAGIVGSSYLLGKSSSDDGRSDPHPTPPALPAQTESSPTAEPPAQPSTAMAQPALEAQGKSPVDSAMQEALKLSVQEKIKDAIKGRPFKINIYSDDGARWSRAKVDLDRDDKWDEKWTFKPDGTVEKQVAPADDENYTQTFARDGENWRAL